MKKIIVLFLLSLPFYAFLCIKILDVSFQKDDGSQTERQSVLSDTTQEDPNVTIVYAQPTATPTPLQLPFSYSIPIIPRKQFFNLSCEFASSSTILYYFTKNPSFLPNNEENSEKILIKEIGFSQNPNIGIRMGTQSAKLVTEDTFDNFNQKFGTTDYYGVHAPPFIKVFAKYGLSAKPILQANSIEKVKKALSFGHLVMAWTNDGLGKTVQIPLSYGGTVPLIYGEHTLVINGYDEEGFTALDSVSGKMRDISYSTLSQLTKIYTIPFLEVYPSERIDTINQFQPTYLQDFSTGLDRSLLTIRVVNTSGQVGQGSEVATILSDYGYNVLDLTNGQTSENQNITVAIKESKRDYLSLLERDLGQATFVVVSSSADLDKDQPVDAVISVGL